MNQCIACGSKQCIVCGSKRDLNTIVTVQVDGKAVQLSLCAAHEETTPKKARELYSQRCEAIQELLKQARELGFEFQVPTDSSDLSLPVAAPVAKNKSPTSLSAESARTTSQSATTPQSASDADQLPTERIDAVAQRVRGASGTLQGGMAIEAHAAYDLDTLQAKLPEHARSGQARVATVPGRGGIPLTIPVERIDGTGTTHVNIAPVETDQDLQRRFKEMARRGEAQFSAGYHLVACTMCKDGWIRTDRGTQVCPRCHGSGVLRM